ncbi:MAG: mannose-1-phosphate guanylyltransferase, partial [Bacteroidia bacterium]|nr:mannose-1-phosphate guanylyltransferase [Bacteroidia bacterium]
SLFHKAKMIKAYFDELNPPYTINYLEESKPLGTAGILSQLQGSFMGSLFLTNCDTIINCNYNDLVQFHDKNNYDITLVGSMINHCVPYGICEIGNEGKLVSLKEKPEYSYLVSTGMYVLRGTVLKHIPHNEHFDMTDLIEKVRKINGTIGVYPISEKSWLDTGEWQEYKKTVEQLSL